MERRQRARDQPESDLREAVDFEPVESTEDDLVPVSASFGETDTESSQVQRTDAGATRQQTQLSDPQVTRLEEAQEPQVTEAETLSGQEEEIATSGLEQEETGPQQDQATDQEIQEDEFLGGFAGGSGIEVSSALAEDEQAAQNAESQGRVREDVDARGRVGLRNRLRQRTGLRSQQDARTGLSTQLRLDTRLRTDLDIIGRSTVGIRGDTDTPITPRPDPEFEDDLSTNQQNQQEEQVADGVGVSRIVDPGWFAETVEAAGMGPTIAPRSGLAADPGTLSEVEAAGFDLATEAVSEPSPGVEATGEVFGLDLDDDEDEQQTEADGLFAGFGSFGGFGL
jgi:hypothetical protein